MKALLLYIGLVIVGAAIATSLGLYLEQAVNSIISLIVFLALFFGNFIVSWIIVIYVMDGRRRSDA